MNVCAEIRFFVDTSQGLIAHQHSIAIWAVKTSFPYVLLTNGRHVFRLAIQKPVLYHNLIGQKLDNRPSKNQVFKGIMYSSSLINYKPVEFIFFYFIVDFCLFLSKQTKLLFHRALFYVKEI